VEEENNISYFRGKSETKVDIDFIKNELAQFLQLDNLNFLLGAGCSSHIENNVECGIPGMANLYKGFFEEHKEFKIADSNVESVFDGNLEKMLETMWAISVAERVKQIDSSIEEKICTVQKYIRDKIIDGLHGKEVLNFYHNFYIKTVTQGRKNPINIFTTNYDLYSERAMDSLGIHYVNGFTGGISKYFNPTIFNYALAEKMDLSQSKWNVIDNFFYLYKIHGSVNWVENDDEGKLFKIQEIQDPTFDILENKPTVMIHPTPLKYNASLGSPYSDLFREFQKKLMRNNNILVTIGYSFSDEHINNLIFQAFTIPSFRLIIIGEPNEKNIIGKLQKLDDSRIWIIGEKRSKDKNGEEDWSYIPINYFNRFVNEILPDLTNEDLDKKLESTINNLKDLLR